MWETIKNDPILKTVTIIILSILGFGFAFNIMFGQNNSGMGHGHSSGGYPLGNTLSYIFILAFEVLLILLVVAAIFAIIRLVRKYLLKGGEIKMFDSIKKDPVLKGITVVVLLVIAFGLIYYLFGSILGSGGGYSMMNGYTMTWNAGNSLGLSGLLAVLLKLLLIASVAGLIIGIVMYVKQNYGKEIADKLSTAKVVSKTSVCCSDCGTAISVDFKYCPHCGGNVKEQCTSCGAELNKEWKCCPACGTEKGVNPT